MPFFHFVDNHLVRHVLRAEYYLIYFINLNNIRHLTHITQESAWNFLIFERRNQSYEIWFYRSALQKLFNASSLIFATNNEESFLCILTILEARTIQKISEPSCKTHFRSDPYHTQQYQCPRETQLFRQQGIQYQYHDATREDSAHCRSYSAWFVITS